MKLNLKAKFLLSYMAVIVVTLAILEWFIRLQIINHFNELYEVIRHGGLRFPETPRDFEPGLNFLSVLQDSVLFTILAAGLLAFLFSLVVTRAITGPVQEVIDATKEIARGKYQKRVPQNSDDELGELGESLNSMAEALENNQYLQRQLLTNVAHELATPLTNIHGYLEALEDDMIKTDVKKTYAMMQEETLRLKNMVDEIRSLSAVQEPQFKVKKSPTNVQIETEKVLAQMQTRFNQAKIPLSLKTELKTKTFNLDADRYHQILLNLLNNALQHSKSKNSVIVSLRQEGKNLLLVVEDHGTGIPRKELPFIFERFYRTDNSRSRKTGGLGVGLTIVKELMEAHGGRIFVTSEEGKGTTFTCKFPA